LARKYEKYVKEITYVKYPGVKPSEKPFREMLLFDANEMNFFPFHFEVFIIRKDGVRDGVSDVTELPADVAEFHLKRISSGLPAEPKSESMGYIWRTKNGKYVFRGWPMYHTADEIFLFFGTDPDNPTDLGGEVEFWLGLGEDAEKYIITKPSCIYVPAGLVHAPIVWRNVRRPFIEIICTTIPRLHEHQVPLLPPDYKPPKKSH
jgi:mannose-6-phosphate isomerase-like protein (cupin superfamily)